MWQAGGPPAGADACPPIRRPLPADILTLQGLCEVCRNRLAGEAVKRGFLGKGDRMNTNWQARLLELPGAAPLEYRHNEWWMASAELDVQAMARLMLALGAPLSTMTGAALDARETALLYHYVPDGASINFKTRTRDNRIASITPITRAANWIEREIHDLFCVEFVGHPGLARLLRPEQVPPGFFREPGGSATRP